MHPELHTDLDNLDTVQHNLRNSAKGSNDAYDVTVPHRKRGVCVGKRGVCVGKRGVCVGKRSVCVGERGVCVWERGCVCVGKRLCEKEVV